MDEGVGGDVAGVWLGGDGGAKKIVRVAGPS